MAVFLSLLLTGTLVWAAPGPYFSRLAAQARRTGYDPLSQTEQDLARTLAFQNPALSVQLDQAQQTELLLIERHQEAKSATRQGDWPRRADVYIYNYNTDTLIRTIVNLETGVVDSLETSQHVQLPLTERETAQAIQIALADPKANAAIQTQYQAIAGRALTDPAGQLRIQAMIFRAEARPDQKLGDAADCGLRRCAQLIMATQDDFLINLLPVVDLSGRKLLSANSFLEE
jgi:hypothetical protein